MGEIVPLDEADAVLALEKIDQLLYKDMEGKGVLTVTVPSISMALFTMRWTEASASLRSASL